LGNELLLSGKVSEAIGKYTEGLELLSLETEREYECESCAKQNMGKAKCMCICIEKSKLYSNRSHAYYMCGDFEKSLENAQKCIETRPDWDKGYIRKALAFIETSNMNTGTDKGTERWSQVEAIYKQGIENCGDTEMLSVALEKLSHVSLSFQRASSPFPLRKNRMTPTTPTTTPVTGTCTGSNSNINSDNNDAKHVVWDEATLEKHRQERGKLYGTMKIDQPDTPFLVGVDIENNLIGQVHDDQSKQIQMLDIDKLKEKLEILQVRQEKGEDLVVNNTSDLPIQEQKEILRKRREDFLKARENLYTAEARYLH